MISKIFSKEFLRLNQKIHKHPNLFKVVFTFFSLLLLKFALLLPSEKLMSPRMCRSLMEANTSTTMPTVCSPSVSQMTLSIAPPSALSGPPYPDPNPEPEPASSPSEPSAGPGLALPPGPALQFPCTHSSAAPACEHRPGDSQHPSSVVSLLLFKSSLVQVKLNPPTVKSQM